MQSLAALALDVNAANHALGNEASQAAGATFVRNRSYPRIYDANHVTGIAASTPEEIEALLLRVEKEYWHCGHRRFDVDFRTPPEVAARLALEGYRRDDALVMLLEGELAGKAPAHEIRAVRSDADWEEYGRLFAMDWAEHMQRHRRPAEPDVGMAAAAVHRLKQPPVQYWLACVGGKAVAYMNSWPGMNGMGQVEDLFTHPEFRHGGLATALIHRCVADCRRKGAGPVVIVADPGDTPKRMYAALGFRPVAIASTWLLRLDQEAAAG